MLNALIRRELMTLLRRRRMMALQVGLAVLFATLVAIRWPTDARVALTGARSQQVFQLFGYGLLTTVLLIIPVFPATSIVREKKQGTLALLLNTPLGAGRIFAAKLISVLAMAGIIFAMSLPAACACYAMGGLSFNRDLVSVYLLLILTALQCAVLGLLISSYANSIDSAVRLTYGLVIAMSVLSLGPHYFFQGTKTWMSQWGEVLRGISPFAAMMSLTGIGDVANQGLIEKSNPIQRYLVSSLIIALLTGIWTIARLNHRIFDNSRPAGLISDDRSRGVRFFRRLFFLVDPQRRSGGISILANPVMVKEFRCRRFGRIHWLLRLVSVCAIMSLGLTYAATAGTFEWGVETIGGILVVMQVTLILLITPSLSAGLISTERESGGWQLLQTTPLSMFNTVIGKLLSVLLPLILILFATLPGYLVMVYIEPGLELQVKRIVICLAATALFAMLVSAAVGSLFSKTSAATAAAYAILLSICALPLLIWVGRDAPFGHSTVEAALTLNPIAAALSVIRTPGFQNYALIPANWWFLGAGSAFSLVVLFTQALRISRPQ